MRRRRTARTFAAAGIAALAILWVQPAAATPSLTEMAYLADAAYAANEKKEGRRKTPDGFTLLKVLRHKSGIQSAVYEKSGSREIVFAIAGTEFTDPRDLLADLGIAGTELKSVMKEAIDDLVDNADFIPNAARKGVKDAFKAVFGIGKKHRRSKGREIMKKGPKVTAKLKRQVAQALTLFDEAASLKKSDGRAIEAREIFVTGHSLGGYLAQVVGTERATAGVVTFNAPGASTYIRNAKVQSRIVNHSRRSDIVGRLGGHVGDLSIYRNARFRWKRAHKALFLANHTLTIMKRDFRDGMTAKR